MEIIFELQEVEARDRALRDICLPHWRVKDALLGPAPPSRNEILHDLLGLAENSEARAVIDVGRRGDVGPADHDRRAPRAAHLDDSKGIRLLKQHSSGHHHISPVEVCLDQRFGVAIDKPHLPGFREQGGDGNQAERRRRITRPGQFACCPVIPERIGIETRKYHQHLAGVDCHLRNHSVPISGCRAIQPGWPPNRRHSSSTMPIVHRICSSVWVPLIKNRNRTARSLTPGYRIGCTSIPRFKRVLVKATHRFVSPTISGTTETPLLEPVGSRLSRASSKNSPARWRSSPTRSGSAAITWSAANAAAALAGDRPTLKTKPGALNLRFRISAREPAIYPPQLASDLLSVPIQMSTSLPESPKCSRIPRPRAPNTPSECASSIIRKTLWRSRSSTKRGRSGKSPSML